MKLVLVSCCAPCSAGAIKQLVDGQIPDVDDFVVLFFNPNIYPMAEYEKRMAEQIRYCDTLGVRHVELEYDHDAWRAAVRGLESEPERGARCSVCFEYRFRRAAAWARENGYDAVASVLGVSRHKDQAQVDRAGMSACESATPRHVTDMTPPAQAVEISTFQARSELPPPGRGLARACVTGGGPSSPDIKYIPIKWDEALRQQIGRQSDFYRQNYCGCEFSIRKV